MFSEEQDRLFATLAECAAIERVAVYVVGGTIRDLFLGVDPGDRDIDFLVEGNAITFAEKCQQKLGGTLKRFNDFYTAKIVSPNGYQQIEEVDLASSRTETYPKPGALPQVSLATIADDLKRRDFTINAMAVPLDKLRSWGRVSFGNGDALSVIALDYFNGRADLGSKIVRVIHDKSFVDDPTRIFRAIRYAVRLDGKLESDTESLVVSGVEGGILKSISSNRALNELKKMTSESGFALMIRELDRLGVLPSLGLYPSACSSLVTTRVSVLKENFPKLSSDLLYRTMLRIFFAAQLTSLSIEKVQTQYHSFGFGRKEVALMAKETTLSLNGVSESDPGLLFQSISDLPRSRAILENELRRRGLL